MLIGKTRKLTQKDDILMKKLFIYKGIAHHNMSQNRKPSLYQSQVERKNEKMKKKCQKCHKKKGI